MFKKFIPHHGGPDANPLITEAIKALSLSLSEKPLTTTVSNYKGEIIGKIKVSRDPKANISRAGKSNFCPSTE